MRTVCLLVLFCFLIAMPVAAESVGKPVPGVVKTFDTTRPVIGVPATFRTTTAPTMVTPTVTIVKPVTVFHRDVSWGYIDVNTSVPGARISVDDQYTGRVTPQRINLTYGEHTIGLTKIGYNSTKFNVTIPEGQGSYDIYLYPALYSDAAFGRNMSVPNPGNTGGIDHENIPVLVVSTTAGKALPAGISDSGAIQANPPNIAQQVTPEKDTGGILGAIYGIFSGWFGGKASCPEGTTACANGCADLKTDNNNCGGCGITCFNPAVCSNGQCTMSPSLKGSVDPAGLPNVTPNEVIVT